MIPFQPRDQKLDLGNGFLRELYARLALRLGRLKLRWGRRLQTDGMAFVGPGVKLEIGKDAVVRLGRWSWIGHGSKIRAHEGEVRIGAKTVLGQECTISCFQHCDWPRPPRTILLCNPSKNQVMHAHYPGTPRSLVGFVGSLSCKFDYRIEQMYLPDLCLHFFAEYCANFRANTVI